MGAYLVRRVVRGLSTLLGTTLIVFVLVRIVPADPAITIAGPKADPETLAAIRADLGLDDPVPVQYARYLWALAHGDLGQSYVSRRRVTDLIGERVGATALLALTSVSVAFVLALMVGIATAVQRGSAVDLGVLVVTLVGLSVPTFFVGNLLIYALGYHARLLPLGGYGTPGLDRLRHLLMPATTLALVHFFFYARFVHANVSTTLTDDYVRTARAKGASPARVYFRHALRNALIPIVTLLGLDVAALMSGAVLTENVFNWPGLGRLAVQAVFRLDLPLAAGTILFSGLLVLSANLLVDLLYGVIDPRVERE